MTAGNVATSCPHCGRTNDNHDGPTRDTKPRPGDVSFCWSCRGLAFFDRTPLGVLTLRLPTPEEHAELDADPNVRAALAAAAESYTPAQAADLRWGRA